MVCTKKLQKKDLTLRPSSGQTMQNYKPMLPCY